MISDREKIETALVHVDQRFKNAGMEAKQLAQVAGVELFVSTRATESESLESTWRIRSQLAPGSDAISTRCAALAEYFAEAPNERFWVAFLAKEGRQLYVYIPVNQKRATALF